MKKTLLLLALLGLTGCVERRMTIHSEPQNALVVLDGQEIGHTPVSVNFNYYGERQIKLIKDGYETQTINQTISTPWYQIPPLDFVSEVLVPLRIHDHRPFLYHLQPSVNVPNDQLLQRAEEVRDRGRNVPPDVARRAGVSPE